MIDMLARDREHQFAHAPRRERVGGDSSCRRIHRTPRGERALERGYVELGVLSLEPALGLEPASQGPQPAFAVLGDEVVEGVSPPRVQAAPPAIDTSAADQSLAEMAQRLEAALRKPKAPEPRATPTPADDDEAEPPADEQVAAPPPAPRAARAAEAKPIRTEAKPKEGKALYDTLEQEMASLLGRPPNKT